MPEKKLLQIYKKIATIQHPCKKGRNDPVLPSYFGMHQAFMAGAGLLAAFAKILSHDRSSPAHHPKAQGTLSF
ncbi:MAG: hypothetical protein HQL63_04165 [Magnetococcales bacterium]|nr:hypothetical protein [Magnetococcales bacterium]